MPTWYSILIRAR